MNDNKQLSFLEKIKIKKSNISPQSGEFTLSYFPEELATTIGNTLRRLLDSVPGWAIFALKISDQEKTVASEISSLAKVRETVPYLILHLKDLIFQSKKDKPELGEIIELKINIDNSKSDEEYRVTGKDVRGELEVINPEIYLATIAPHGQLKIELYCRFYWGDHLADKQSHLLSNRENVIFLKTNYRSVKQSFFQVDPIMVALDGEEKNLTLKITTNGNIKPEKALLLTLEYLEQISVSLQKNLTLLIKK